MTAAVGQRRGLLDWLPPGLRRPRTEATVAAGAVSVIFMLIVPLPHWLLDLLLAVNITMALGILMMTFYLRRPLDFSSFPSVLLMVTLFRLALNVAATRLILGEGSAGAVIHAFGTFVIGGNTVVGIVVFTVLVVIQFVVITSGAGRVAEVAARFTLDALPGKQMAIDAELNAGAIDEVTARQRRQEVSREADFYGAMDGASKFTRGDAIAAVVMIIVNILGGFAVGMFQRGMDLAGAFQSYTLLTVGEGLVTQVPALLISAASGLIVTRTAGEANLGTEVGSQLVAHPQALLIASGVLVALAMAPGMPKLPFLLLAAGLGTYAYRLRERRLAPPPKAVELPPKPPENMTELLTVDPLEVELGYALVCLADAKQDGDLLERITAVRRQIAGDLGFIVPPIRVRDNVRLRGNQYVVRLRGLSIGEGELFPGHVLAMDAGGVSQSLSGIEAKDPAFGLAALWLPASQRTLAEVAGYTVADASNVLVTHLSELLRRHAGEILTRQDVQALLDAVKQHSAAVVDEVTGSGVGLGHIQKVLQLLLRERVSIRDLETILEAIADAPAALREPDLLVEQVRQRLARMLTRQHATSDGVLHCFTLHPAVETVIVDAARRTDAGLQLLLEPTLQQQLLEKLRVEAERMVAAGRSPLLLCAPRVRGLIRPLAERATPSLVALSYAEVAPGGTVESMGMVTM